jgi:hypothetical protein
MLTFSIPSRCWATSPLLVHFGVSLCSEDDNGGGEEGAGRL